MRKILVLLLVFGLVLGCAGVVSASMTISGSESPKVNDTITYSVSPVTNATTYTWEMSPTLSPTTSSSGSSISYKFTQAGTYTLSVKALNDSTELDNGSKTITVSLVAAPVAAFTASPQDGGAPLKVAFTSTSTNAASLSWDFGVSGASNPTTTSATYTYENSGTYTVKLTAKNSAGVENSTTKTITVKQVPVTTIDVSPKIGTAPLSVMFKATASNTPTSYKWDFGDNSAQATTLNTNHTYTTAGTYNVSFTATNANGTSVAKTTTITVNANTSAYKVAIDATPVKGTAPLKVTFKLNTTIPSTDITKIEWDFGYDKDDDGDDEFSSSANPDAQTYTKEGKYTVKVSVVTPAKTYTDSVTITVSDLVASFTASKTSGPAPLEVKFTDTSSGPTSWLWTIYKMNDQNTRTSVDTKTTQNITYTFNNEGTYEVELTAKKDSKSVTTYQKITVSAKATTAPTTKATTKATTAPTTAATTSQAVKAAALSSDDNPVPNPMDIIEEFIRLIKVMLVPENYNLAI